MKLDSLLLGQICQNVHCGLNQSFPSSEPNYGLISAGQEPTTFAPSLSPLEDACRYVSCMSWFRITKIPNAHGRPGAER